MSDIETFEEWGIWWPAGRPLSSNPEHVDVHHSEDVAKYTADLHADQRVRVVHRTVTRTEWRVAR